MTLSTIIETNIAYKSIPEYHLVLRIFCRTWNDLCLHMLVTLIKISDGQIFYDSDVDVGVCVKGGIPIRVGKIVFDLPLMIEAKQQDKLRPYTSYITSGMWLQGRQSVGGTSKRSCALEEHEKNKA